MAERITTPLAKKLVARIRTAGPMTVAEYMAACLGDPEHGYYLVKDPFGSGGDFITAPEVSQIFGELIGLWAVATWQAMGAPNAFRLVEIGPGRGTLMSDALRAARIRPAFVEAARLHLVETSPKLREIQTATLANVGSAPAWHDRVEDVPAGPMILVANEFFDALPVHQFVWTSGGWAERMVGVNDDGTLAFGLGPPSRDAGEAHLSHRERSDRSRSAIDPGEGSGLLGNRSNPSPDTRWNDRVSTSPYGRGEGAPPPTELGILEISPSATAIVAAIAERIARDRGAALIIDYGYEGPAFGDTLQAVREHRYDDPLAAPGEADLTAHVDFGALARAADGALARPLLSQGEFLARLGISERAAALSRGKGESVQRDIEAGVARLTGSTAMGDLFKVLAIAPPGLALPAFDRDA